ncbi:PREDICTED: uncharacterized protein LOC105456679 [Wasmannia auropunctata]|uniref:uncharacterized protein LOC105456679 n=1 Tax=Wasmannia auropunctata TaxID=64793 RepID=UPI0005F07902|nr:PREDICTED: uncharacterized protein LOC105456679 [Wasmannia auropunctata]
MHLDKARNEITSTQQKGYAQPCSQITVGNNDSVEDATAMEMDAQGSPPLISVQNSEKGNNKRSYSVLEEGSEDTSAPSVSATSLPSAHAPSSARSSHLGPENPKAQKLEGKTNNYTNQDQAPYLVHVYALNNSNNNNNNGHLHPMRMFAQVGRIMPAADIIEMRKLGLGQSLPSHVILFWARHAVRPYIPKARFCTKCYRVGHSNVICRSPARCLRCGGPVHAENSICPEESSTPKCINCSGSSNGIGYQHPPIEDLSGGVHSAQGHLSPRSGLESIIDLLKAFTAGGAPDMTALIRQILHLVRNISPILSKVAEVLELFGASNVHQNSDSFFYPPPPRGHSSMGDRKLC